MKTLRYAALALAVSGVFTLGARAGDTTNNWWNVDFQALEYCDLINQTEGPNGAMVVLTNTTIERDGREITHRTWEEGEWVTLDGDETIVTNSYFPTNTYKAFGQDTCLKLDTQGNDLTWTPAPTSTVSLLEGVKTLVDADLYLVGSDSAPDTGDFDAAGDVQTAIYLKNETDEDSGETTNSVLCVYAYDSDKKANYWQELKGVEMEDNAWFHVQVLVDHSLGTPMVRVYVNNTQMTARDGDAVAWTVANTDVAQAAKKVSSVSFRGTGAVDNFVGVAVETTYDTFNFTAQVLMDGTNVLATGDEGNVTRTLPAEAGEGKSVTFSAFEFHDQHWDDNAWNEEDQDYTGNFVVSYALTKIEIVDFVHNTTQTFNYGYDKVDGVIVPVTESPYIVFATETGTDENDEEYEYYSGPFSISAPTVGATADSTIVKVYFETLPADGDFKLTASQNVGEAPPDQKFNVNTLAVDETTFTFAQSLTDGGTSYILSTITVGATPAGIEAAVSGTDVVVTVPLSNQIAEGVYNVATATYVEGSLADGEALQGARDGNVYTYTKYTPPVAIIIAGTVTNKYDSLRGAITNATAGDTIYLLRDDKASFTAENPEIEIDKNITIDGGSNTLYGVTDFSGGYHDIFISAGNVTIKDLKITEFGDTAPFNRDTYPIWTAGAYDGELVLDGVTIDKFVRTAVNLGGGTVLITNCTFTADPTAYFQTGVETLDADVTVVDTTITGVNSTITGEDSDAAAVFTLNGYGEYTGSGTITVLSGDYSGQFIVAVNPNATGSAILSNGTFVATAPAEDEGQPLSAFLVDGLAATIEVAGGWYDREPAGYVANGLTAVQDADNAPDPAATWTVKAAAVQIEGDTTKSYLSIAEAQAAAATAGIDDPVFVIVAPLSAETVTLAAAEDTLTVKTDDTGFLANLEVVTSLAGSDAVEYAVEPRTVGLEPPITVTYMVVPTYYVAKIVDGGTTTKYETFTAAATVAMAETPTLVVEMVANTNAVEDAFAITGSLKVKAGGFLIPELVPEDRSHYLDASEPDENGVVTYTSKAYLTATFLNGDGSTLQEVAVRVGETPIPTFDFGDVEPYPPAQPGYVVHFAMTWTPAIGPISEDTVFRPNFTTNVMDYSIQYVLDGGDWPAGYTPPEWYAVTNATIELPSPAKDGWTFNGWYTNKTDGAYVGDLVNPGTIPTGSYGPKFFYASWTESSVTPDPVDPGDSLTAADKANGNLPIAVTDAGFVVKFRSKQPGVTYQLVYSTSLTVADWTACPTTGNAEVSPATASDENPELIVLTAPIGTDTVKFFKIKATK